MPNYLHDIDNYLMDELKKYENKCIDDVGIIISIQNIIDIDNIINKSSIDITFFITFNALTFKPLKDMIISFTPNMILKKGVFGNLYKNIHFFIPIENLEENQYVFDNDCFVKNNFLINKTKEIKVKIIDINYDTIKYNCITNLI